MTFFWKLLRDENQILQILLLINIDVYRILAKKSDKLYEILSCIRRFHVYKDRLVPVVDEVLQYWRETLNTQDQYAVSVMESESVAGHLLLIGKCLYRSVVPNSSPCEVPVLLHVRQLYCMWRAWQTALASALVTWPRWRTCIWLYSHRLFSTILIIQYWKRFIYVIFVKLAYYEISLERKSP